MPFEFGDVVLVPFPFTDQTASKKRPAVGSRAYNTARPDIIVMAITSQRRPNPGLGDVLGSAQAARSTKSTWISS